MPPPLPHRGPRETTRASVLVAVFLVVLFIAPVLPPSAWGGGGDARETPPSHPLEGQPLFETKGCMRCHGIWAPPGEEHVGPDLGRDESSQDVMQFAGTLWNHAPQMIETMHAKGIAPPVLSPDEMGRLAVFLFYAKFLGGPGDAERGRDIFQKRSCATCHQFGGHGGTVGPRLDELKDFASPVFFAQALWNHGPEMAAKMAELELDRPRLAGPDVADIVALIRGESRAAARLELPATEIGSPRAGKSLFRDKGCVQCHAIDGDGGHIGPNLGSRRAETHVTDLAAALWNHGPPMWAKMTELHVPFPKVTNPEMADLLAYLYFVQYIGERGNADRGDQIFAEKSCSRCHAAGTEGSKAAPDLARSEALASPMAWTAAMWNHAGRDKAGPADIEPWPRFGNDDMRDLVEFLRSRGGK